MQFWIGGEPVSSARPRAFAIKGKGGKSTARVHKGGGKKLAAWEALVKQAAHAAATDRASPVWGRGLPLAVTLCFYIRRPLYHYVGNNRDGRPLKPASPQIHTHTPDIDNLMKAVLDACSSILWHDDRQIGRIECTSLYTNDDTPGCWIRVTNFTDGQADFIRRRNTDEQ